MKNTQTVTNLEYMACAQYVTINKNKFLNLGFEDEDGNLYMFSIPGVMVKKFNKEELKDGEGRVRRAGLQEAPESTTSRSEEQEDQAGSESEDTGAKA